jgi:hypothetical protein
MWQYFTALIFGIHPMHVESVYGYRKEKICSTLCFFFYHLYTICDFCKREKRSKLILCFLFFLLSLLSKPAAIIFPLLLLLLDYWQGEVFIKK